MNTIIRITQLTVVEKGKPLFDENSTQISVVDEAAGEFLEFQQSSDEQADQKIKLNFDEWTTICKAVEMLRKDSEANAPKK